MCFLLGSVWAFADLPFRNHRYDSFKVLEVNSNNIVFLGNSITNMHEWWEAFDNHNIINRGNSGAVSDELLANLESIATGKPAKVFLMIGTNDLGTAGINTTEHVVGNAAKIIDRLQKESPATEIYVQSILPSQSGSRTLPLLSATNDALKALCAEKNVTYIDLWDDLMGITSGTALSLDGLHLKATGYKIWCEKIAPYVGSKCVYLDDATVNSQAAGLAGSFGMRASYFGALPVKTGDVLIIGDEMIHGGEWHELLHCDKVKSRGTGWGYGGLTLAQTLGEIPVILKGRSDNGEPAKIFLYAGVPEVNGTTELATLKTSYQSIVSKVRELAPSAKLYLLSLLPRTDASANSSRIVPFNTSLKEIAQANNNVEFIDIYTPLASNGVANTDYFNGDYVYGKGYAKISQLIAPYLSEEGAEATSDEKADELITSYARRTTLMQALLSASGIVFGTAAGTYPESRRADFEKVLAAADAVMAKPAPTGEEIEAQGTSLSNAIAALLPHINQPAISTADEEHWFQLSTPLRDNRYLTSNGTGEGVTGEAANNLAKSMWKLVAREDGKYNIINRKDGSFLNPTAAYNTQVTTSETEPAKGWEVEYAATPALYIVKSGTVELNQTQSNLGYKIYNWSAGGSGSDRTDTGCQFKIEEVTVEPADEPEELAEGWYTFKVATGSDATMQGYVAAGTNTVLNANAEYRQTASNYYALRYGAYDSEKAPVAWVHLKTSNGMFQIQGLNGHTINENCTSSRDQSQTPTTISGTETVSIDKWHYYNPTDGTENPYVGKSSASSNTFSYSRVKDTELEGYDHYVVSISGAPDASEIGQDATVTCSHSANKGIATVFNGGHFFLTAGTAVTAADFRASEVSGLPSHVAVTDGSVFVLYGEAPEASDLIEEANELLSRTGIGTPASDSEERVALQAAVEAAETAGDDFTAVIVLQNAISRFSQSTNLEMPQAGKAYTFTNVQQDGTTYLLCAGEDGGLAVSAANADAADLGNKAVFVCGEENGKFYFTYAAGNYLVWKGHQGGYNDNTGYVAEYDAGHCLFTLGSGSAAIPGTVYVQGTRSNTSQSGCFILTSEGVFNAWSTGVGISSTYSNLFRIEEAEYPNVVGTVEAEGLGHIGLFSAPFPTVVPKGAKAYAAVSDKTNVGLVEIESDIVPAATGVAIVGQEESYVMVPAMASGTAVSGNLLVASGLEGVEVDAATAAYGLLLTDGAATFNLLAADRAVAPNSAYLSQEEAEESMRVYLGDLTGIGGVLGTPDADAPIYDLSGRRVKQPVRGCYIQGGKKILVK